MMIEYNTEFSARNDLQISSSDDISSNGKLFK